VLDGFLGDGVVLEVDEAGVLEAVEDGIGCLLASKSIAI
jgi:hypothetical protein